MNEFYVEEWIRATRRLVEAAHAVTASRKELPEPGEGEEQKDEDQDLDLVEIDALDELENAIGELDQAKLTLELHGIFL